MKRWGQDSHLDIELGTALTPNTVSIPLPSPTDPTSIASYITSMAGAVLSFLALFHVGVPKGTDQIIDELAMPVGLLIAGGVQVFNAIRIHVGTKAATAIALTLTARPRNGNA